MSTCSATARASSTSMPRYPRERETLQSNIGNWSIRHIVRQMSTNPHTPQLSVYQSKHRCLTMIAYEPIQCISGSFRGTGGGADFGWPTMIGATGT